MKNFKALAMLILWFATIAIHSYAKPSPLQESVEGLVSSNIKEHTDCCSMDFEVNVEETGDYYMECWMLPAKRPDNSYSQYTVSVNNKVVGLITPEHGNWQGLSIDGNGPIKLEKGQNKLSIKALAPEMPMVESIRISSTNTGHLFSSEAYSDYLSNAKKGIVTSENIDPSSFEEVSALSPDDMVFENVGLEYTFYKPQLFTENQDIFIATSSSIEHDIDMVYLGAEGFPSIIGEDSSDTSSEINDLGGLIGSPIRTKLYLSYIPASSAEMQGLNWRGRSEYSLNLTAYLATIHITIPKTGYYILRVRARETGQIGVADININGDYFYEEVPITYSQVSCTIPVDGSVYGCGVRSANPTDDDPLLFMESFISQRVVGFNDDAASKTPKDFKLGTFDSYLAQAYSIKTSGISVSNYSSNTPKSTCTIIVRKLDSSSKMPKREAADGEDTPDGYIDGKPYIDLGLPSGTLWAMYNLGTEESYGYGDYFAWGETSPKKQYSWETYKYFEGEFKDPNNGSIWYNTTNIGADIQHTQYDAATAIWGSKWEIPTEVQLHELRRSCWHEWTNENGVYGVRIHGPNQHSIFLPAAGIVENIDKTPVPYAGVVGIYWSATESWPYGMPDMCNQSAYTLIFDSGTFGIDTNQRKDSGISIRPVVAKTAVAAASSVESERIVVKCSATEVIVEGCHASDRIEVYNISGQLLASRLSNGATFRHTLPGKGIYILSVSNGDALKKKVKLIL